MMDIAAGTVTFFVMLLSAIAVAVQEKDTAPATIAAWFLALLIVMGGLAAVYALFVYGMKWLMNV
jgi:hypothetical protein